MASTIFFQRIKSQDQESTQSDNHAAGLFNRIHEFLHWQIDAQVEGLKSIHIEHKNHKILPDVMDITGYCRYNDLACSLCLHSLLVHAIFLGDVNHRLDIFRLCLIKEGPVAHDKTTALASSIDEFLAVSLHFIRGG